MCVGLTLSYPVWHHFLIPADVNRAGRFCVTCNCGEASLITLLPSGVLELHKVDISPSPGPRVRGAIVLLFILQASMFDIYFWLLFSWLVVVLRCGKKKIRSKYGNLRAYFCTSAVGCRSLKRKEQKKWIWLLLPLCLFCPSAISLAILKNPKTRAKRTSGWLHWLNKLGRLKDSLLRCVCVCVFVQDDADAHHTDISVIEQDKCAVQLILYGLIGLSKWAQLFPLDRQHNCQVQQGRTFFFFSSFPYRFLLSSESREG